MRHWFNNQASGYDWISRTTRIAIYMRDKYTCLACGASPSDDVRLSLDHLEPNGGNRPSNLVTLCLSCNSARRDTPAAEWSRGFAARAQKAVVKPLDRSAALAVAKARWPGRYERARVRAQQRKAAQRRSLA